MNYIYQHNILGIRMALYDEKKPEEKDYELIPFSKEWEDDKKMEGSLTANWATIFRNNYISNLEHWIKSRIAYLKEPEFRVDDEFYNIGNTEIEGKVERISGQKVYYRDVKGKPCWNYKKHLSHYYPGQEVESFKYVREITVETFEWQEVEDPEEVLIEYSPNINKEVRQELSTNPDYTQFQEDVDKAIILAEINTKKL